jgi:hypothetical protein
MDYALYGLALTATRSGDVTRAATLRGFVHELEAGFDTEDALLRDADHARLRSVLGEDHFDAAHQAGRTMSLDDALTLSHRLT